MKRDHVKIIEFQGNKVQITKHARNSAKHGRQACEAACDAAGTVYYKGKTGKWTKAHQALRVAKAMLDAQEDS